MIQINATTHTDLNGSNGVTVSTGSVLDVNPHFKSYRIYDADTGAYLRVQHDISFDVKIYKNMASFESDDPILINSAMKEYNIGFTAVDVNIQALTSVSDLLGLLKDHIEQGDSRYPGVGIGNAAIVWPS